MAHLDQRPQSTPRQLFPLNPCSTHLSFEAPRGPAKGTGVTSSLRLPTPPLLRKKKDVCFTSLQQKGVVVIVFYRINIFHLLTLSFQFSKHFFLLLITQKGIFCVFLINKK